MSPDCRCAPSNLTPHLRVVFLLHADKFGSRRFRVLSVHIQARCYARRRHGHHDRRVASCSVSMLTTRRCSIISAVRCSCRSRARPSASLMRASACWARSSASLARCSARSARSLSFIPSSCSVASCSVSSRIRPSAAWVCCSASLIRFSASSARVIRAIHALALGR